MQQIPVYSFTGFLDSGKTKFIQETLEDSRFNDGERTLLLIFEEGEEEYDFSTYPAKNVWMEVLDQQTVTTKQLTALQKRPGSPCLAVRVSLFSRLNAHPDSHSLISQINFCLGSNRFQRIRRWLVSMCSGKWAMPSGSNEQKKSCWVVAGTKGEVSADADGSWSTQAGLRLRGHLRAAVLLAEGWVRIRPPPVSL